ncbi:hypothetical protein ATCC90586_002664 [Pythium insidiosum]|nr:hypothetical protein ATCC90586_002664 [Pythium insidiosum]
MEPAADMETASASTSASASASASTSATAAVGAMMDGRLLQENALSWPEVQEICKELEHLYRKDAQKDAARVRALARKRKEISAACQEKKSTAQQQLNQLLGNVRDWEQQSSTAKARRDELAKKLQELEALKREMVAQLERVRVDEQSSKESLERLLDTYETARQEALKFQLEHRNEIDRAKHFMSLYAAVTGIKWDFSGDSIAGEIHIPRTQEIVPFEIDSTQSNDFETANALWAKIDAAFDALDNNDEL